MNPDDLEYLHIHTVEEQLIGENCKIDTLYGDTSNYSDQDWFMILSEEFGEIAQNMGKRYKGQHTQIAFQENLEYELLQLIVVANRWLKKLRSSDKKTEE